MANTEARFESPEQMAARYNIKSVETIMRRLRKGEIPGAIKVGRLWRIPIEVSTPTPPPPPLSAEDTAGDPEITAAQKENALQKIKTDTAIEAEKERKSKMFLQGCHDCEALQKSTAELATDLARREAKYAEDSEALAEREAELNEVSRQVAANKLAIESAIKFNANWKESYSLYQEVKQCLETLRPRLGYLGYPASIQAGPAAIKKLERILLKGLHEAK